MRLATRRFLFVALLVLGALPASAQRPPEQLDGSAILHRMQKLGVIGSVLYLAAHPDDENTRLISYLSNGQQVRTAYLSLTRGDGGQNLIGPELGAALGVLRTQELLEARRIDGGEQFFTRAVDFGYSKTPEETLGKWGDDEVLADVVRVVRAFRPDVIVTRFDTDGSGGHGQHTASALLAHQAFDVAADPSAFPEQIEAGLEPWQTKRLFFNGSSWWRRDLPEFARANPTEWIEVDVGGYDPLLGASYTELAGRSRSQHKSQGFGAAETRGKTLEYLRLDKGKPLTTPQLFDGIELGWDRIEGSGDVRARLDALLATYDPSAPERSLPRLGELLTALNQLTAEPGDAGHWARHHAAATRDLMLQVGGFVFEAGADRPSVAAGEALDVTLSALHRQPGPIPSIVSLFGPEGTPLPGEGELTRNEIAAFELALNTTTGSPIDQPYWLAEPYDSLYRPAREHTGIEPTSTDGTTYGGVIAVGGQELRVERPLLHTWVDRVDGQRTRAAVVTPVASIQPVDTVVVVTEDSVDVAVEVEALAERVTGTLELFAPTGWTVADEPRAVEELGRGERERFIVRATRTSEAVAGPLRFRFTGPTGTTDRTQHVIDYPHIQPQTWYSPAEVQLVPLDVNVSVRNVGYVDGAGDDLPRAMQRMGIEVERIDPGSAQAEELDRFDAIITGIRAYNTVADMARLQPLLFGYVERGGTLLVQYNTASRDMMVDRQGIGPYPFELTRNRVTVEEATPTFSDPEHALLTTPNHLTGSDFDGWVQERGLYFAGNVDSRYTALIEWNDPGEAPLDGALITCDYGKGRYTYTGISLFRQLPAGVPGAYRLLANLLARRSPRQ